MSAIIVYDRPSAKYVAGETVTGRVIVHVDQPTPIKEITLRLVGETKLDSSLFLIQGTTLHGALMRAVSPPHEIFFKIKTRLLGGGDQPKKQGTSLLQPGVHEYPFEFQLPATAPSSFASYFDTAHTRYSAKAVVRRGRDNAETAESEMTVFEPVDLNLMPQVTEPFEKSDSKYFWTLGSRSGPLAMSVRVPSQGYVPGETIPFQVEVDNKSTFVVHRVEVALSQLVKYYSNMRKFPEPRKLETVELEHSQVKGNESKAFKHSITVPEKTSLNLLTPPTVLNNKSKHVKWKYVLTASAVVDQGHLNLRVTVPIVIGTIPVGEKGRTKAESSSTFTSPPTFSKANQISSEFIKVLT